MTRQQSQRTKHYPLTYPSSNSNNEPYISNDMASSQKGPMAFSNDSRYHQLDSYPIFRLLRPIMGGTMGRWILGLSCGCLGFMLFLIMGSNLYPAFLKHCPRIFYHLLLMISMAIYTEAVSI